MPVSEAVAASGTGIRSCVGRGGLLLVVCLDQALDELVDVARLGQVTPVQLVAQLGLGQALVPLACPLMSLPGLVTLGLTGLACPLPLGLLGLLRLLACGLLSLVGLLMHEATG
jgi:hypothetical protein